MRHVMNKTKFQSSELKLRLNTMWIVEADDSYSVDAKNVAGDSYIAIRTESGAGVIELINSEVFTLTEHTLIILKWSEIKRYFCKNDRWNFKWYQFEVYSHLHILTNQVHSVYLTENEHRISGECFVYISGTSSYEALYAQCQFESLFALWHIIKENPPLIKKNMESALSYIVQNLSSDMKISDISDMLNMSERNFRIIFKKYTGMPPRQYIEDKRLTTAMEMIKTTSMLIKEISALCGFSNQYYFSRCFKEKYGCSPIQARK